MAKLLISSFKQWGLQFPICVIHCKFKRNRCDYRCKISLKTESFLFCFVYNVGLDLPRKRCQILLGEILVRENRVGLEKMAELVEHDGGLT